MHQVGGETMGDGRRFSRGFELSLSNIERGSVHIPSNVVVG